MDSDNEMQSALLAEIYEFLEERGINEVTFGNRSVKDWTVVERLRNGRVTFRVAKRMREYIAAERQARASVS